MERVRNAFGTRLERERSVRLFLSSTVSVFAPIVIRANPGLPGLVDHVQSRYIGETHVDIA